MAVNFIFLIHKIPKYYYKNGIKYETKTNKIVMKNKEITERFIISLGFNLLNDGYYFKNDFTWDIYDKKIRYKGDFVTIDFMMKNI